MRGRFLEELQVGVPVEEENRERFMRLYEGIRNKEDPVTWRTLCVDTITILGSDEPEIEPPTVDKLTKAKALVDNLTAGTYLEPLTPEILTAIGFPEGNEKEVESLDALFFNARHLPEPLLWDVADMLQDTGRSVAVVNPVGHYNDYQTRIVTPNSFTRPVERVVMLSSTQTRYGGSVNVLANVIRTIRNPEFASRVEEVDIVIPMFGGSRGHRVGQTEDIGYEVLEAIFNAKQLAVTTRDVIEQLEENEVGEIPTVRFFSVDIHNDEYPEKVFREEGFEFISSDPVPEFAQNTNKIIVERGLTGLPIRVVACDKGAIPRSERLVAEILARSKGRVSFVDLICIDKKRKTGIVEETRVAKVARFELDSPGTIFKIREFEPGQFEDNEEEFVLVYSDDMIDTGGTAAKDMQLLEGYLPNSSLKIFTATHPVFSKGLNALDRIGADVYLLGNTLDPEGLDEHPKVVIVNMAESIIRAIYDENE